MPKRTTISTITAREIIDSRGNPTIEATVVLSTGISGTAAVPSGASTGIHEAHELRDGGERYSGKGVQKAVKHVEGKIAKALKGKDVTDQQLIDDVMLALDGTEQKTNLGANAMLAVSLAAARAGALATKTPLYQYIRDVFSLNEKTWRMPQPTMNVINGGRHADNGLSIQEFMIVPHHRSFKERVRMGAEVFHALKKRLHKKGMVTAVGDEGGFAPNLKKNKDALTLLMKSIQDAGYTPGKDVSLAMDIAASEFFNKGKYSLNGKRRGISGKKLVQEVEKWTKEFPLVSIEDWLAEDDWDTWEYLSQRIGKKLALVGDDLFVTNKKRLQQGIDRGVGNAILIKVNQIGTLSETIETIRLAKKHKYKVSVSHRSGETGDTFIADLAVAVNADYLKSGSLSRSERVEKYNRVMAIEQEVKKK